MSDYYSILGVEKNADETALKKAYKKSSLKWHPDRHQDNKENATKKFQEINEAYAVLSDPNKKEIYDKYGKQGLDNNGMDMDPQDLFNQFFGRTGGFPMGGMPFDMFGNSFNNESKRKKGPNKKVDIYLSIEEMMNGGKKKISIIRKVKCETCSGSGLKSGKVEDTCKKCKGNGMIHIQRQMGPMITRQSMPCSDCGGTGKIIKKEDKCPTCNGNKYVSKKTEYTVDIPIGVKEGDYELISEMGDESDNYIEPGDIILIFKEKEDSKCYRNGDNLEINMSILLSEALLGFSIPYNHPNKTRILIESTDVITPGTKHKIAGLGFKSGNKMGDLIISFDIVFPKSLESKRKELIGKLLPKRKQSDDTGLNSYKITPYKENITASNTKFNMPENMQEENMNECVTH